MNAGTPLSLQIGIMFLHNRGTIFLFILLFLAHLDAIERQETRKRESHNQKSLSRANNISKSGNDNDRLKKVHDDEIQKLIAGSSKFIRPRVPLNDNRATGLSASKDNERRRKASPSSDSKIDKTIGRGNISKTKSITPKKLKSSSNMRKNQQQNVINNRKNKMKSIRGCAGSGKGSKKGHACHNAGRQVKRSLINIPGAEIIEQWNKTCVIPIPSWFWPGFWAIFG